MSDERKEWLLKHVNYVFNECRRYIESENNDCLNCLEGADTCYQAHEELKRLIQQKSEIDEKYVEEKAGEMFNGLFSSCISDVTRNDFLLPIIKKHLTQIISDVKGREIEVDMNFLIKWQKKISKGSGGGHISLISIRKMLKAMGVKFK